MASGSLDGGPIVQRQAGLTVRMAGDWRLCSMPVAWYAWNAASASARPSLNVSRRSFSRDGPPGGSCLSFVRLLLLLPVPVA